MFNYCMERCMPQLCNKYFYKYPALFIQKQIKVEKRKTKRKRLQFRQELLTIPYKMKLSINVYNLMGSIKELL